MEVHPEPVEGPLPLWLSGRRRFRTTGFHKPSLNGMALSLNGMAPDPNGIGARPNGQKPHRERRPPASRRTTATILSTSSQVL